MFASRKLFITCALVIVSFLPLVAGITASSSKAKGPVGITSSTLLRAEDDFYRYMTLAPTNATWAGDFENKRLNNYVRLKYEESARTHYATSWTVTVVCDLDKWDETGAPMSTETFTLTLTYDPAAGTQYEDIAEFISAAPGYRTEVDVISVSGTVPVDVMLESVVETERYWFFDYEAEESIHHEYNAGNHTLTFYWDYLEGAEEYDLEWTFVSDYDAETTPDFERARRVTLNAQNYTINLPFDNGKIYYRVRGVGRYGNDWDLRLEGAWWNHDGGYTVTNLDATKSWNYSAVYAEDGKRQEVVTFFDGNLRQRQAVTINNSDNVAMQTETFYDYEGRAVIQTLAAPDAAFGSEMRFYTVQSASTATGFQYNRKDYDNDALFAANCTMSSPSGMNTNNGASRYYSSLNNLAAVGYNAAMPDAGLYPFTQVTYDREGRVKKQAAAGEDFVMGKGHETEYFYANPTQERLDRLFGAEAGYAEHYSLRGSKDANGQVSIAYIDLHGRVVATALAGESPDQMQELDNNDSERMTEDLSALNYYDPVDEAWVINTNFFVTNPGGNYDFTYEMTPQQYESMCNEAITGDCKYDLEIRIYDACDAPLTSTGDITLPYTQTEIGPGALSYDFTVQFPAVGTYRIEKRLKLSQSAMQAAIVAFFEALPESDCISSESSFQSGLYNQYTFDCNDCHTWCEQQATALALTGDAWTAYVATCAAEHCTNTIAEGDMNCNVLLDVLKADMKPGGQYFDNVPATTTGTPDDGWLNLYVWNNSLTGAWITADFRDPDNNLITNWDDVRLYWQDEWVDQLVSYHPEYCHYEWCVDMDASDMYDVMMFGNGTNDDANTIVWAETTLIAPLNTDPYIDQTPLSGSVGQKILDQDPFFQVSAPGYAYLSGTDEMQEELDDFQNSGSTMWDYAGANSPCTGCDEQWQTFRAFYIGTKQRFVKAAREADGCYPLHDGSAPPDNVADGTNPAGVNGFTIRWPDYTDDLEDLISIDPQDVDDYVDDMNQAYDVCKTPATLHVTIAEGTYEILEGKCITLGIYDGSSTSTLMAASICGPAEYTAEELVALIVMAINAHVSTPVDYTAAIDPLDPLSYIIYAPASLGSEPNDLYVQTDEFPEGIAVTYSNEGEMDYGAEDADCPQNAHCLCALIDQIVASWGATYYDPVEDRDYYYVNHNTYPDDEDYVYYVLHETDNTVTPEMVENWMYNCADDPAHPEGDPLDEENYEPLTAGIDCANPAVDCDEDAGELTAFWGTYLHQQAMNGAVNNFIAEYKAQCWAFGAMIDHLRVRYYDREYQYTLYYYDQAGSLTRTVPPAAVKPLDLTAGYLMTAYSIGDMIENYRNDVPGAVYVVPDHSPETPFGGTDYQLATYYKYNSLNQIEESTSPDGGTTYFFYDEIGRIIASQNANQNSISGGGYFFYSYIRYDAQGRVIEAGQVQHTTSLTHGTPTGYISYETWLAAAYERQQVTEMYYDAPLGGAGGTIDLLFANGQEYLRKRVSTATYERVWDNDAETYDHASHYSYDVHGNVNTLIQETPELNDLGQRYKYLTYEYDLVSGNVNDVHYQSGEADQMHHHYTYDADNRLTNVYTSTFSVENSAATPTTLQGIAPYDQDAKYFYYLHGPLARTEIGDDKIQGLDYAYTINGWIKGVNSNVLDPDSDLGKDGTATTTNAYIASRTGLHSNVGKDAYGYVLGYYWDDTDPNPVNHVLDWEPIHTPAKSLYGDVATQTDPTHDLFNGNIKEMSTALMKPNVSASPDAMPLIYNQYHYDQLNRIVACTSYTDASEVENYSALTNTNEYLNTFKYDANGNILEQLRNGITTPGVSMDDLTYNYYAGTNQLANVEDAGPSGNYDDDLEDQSLLTTNYEYTPNGELSSDESEGILQLLWDANGKIHSITRITGWSIPGTSPAEYPSDLEFKYDASGNRICKIEKPRDISGVLEEKHWIYTYYVRDAGGHVMSVYTRNKDENLTQYVDEFILTETHVYGAGRLGIKQRGEDHITSNATYEFNGYYTIYPGTDTYNTFNAGDELSHTHPPMPDMEEYTRGRGRKLYELVNHLGNVLVTFYDRKISTDLNTDNVTDYYLADVASARDYSAFGAPIPGRSFSREDYRYGFNGKENDGESVGTGSGLQDYGMRIYNPSLGRFLSSDPISAEIPEESPYQFASNRPIDWIDIYGLKGTPPGGTTAARTTTRSSAPLLVGAGGAYIPYGTSTVPTLGTTPGGNIYPVQQIGPNTRVSDVALQHMPAGYDAQVWIWAFDRSGMNAGRAEILYQREMGRKAMAAVNITAHPLPEPIFAPMRRLATPNTAVDGAVLENAKQRIMRSPLEATAEDFELMKEYNAKFAAPLAPRDYNAKDQWGNPVVRYYVGSYNDLQATFWYIIGSLDNVKYLKGHETDGAGGYWFQGFDPNTGRTVRVEWSDGHKQTGEGPHVKVIVLDKDGNTTTDSKYYIGPVPNNK